MSLIAPADQERLRDAFSGMTRPVRLLFFTRTIDGGTCLQTRQILNELPPLSDRITVEEVNVVLEPDKAKLYAIDRVPAIAVAFEAVPEAIGEHDQGAEAPGVIAERGDGVPAKRDRGAGAPGVIEDSRMRFVGTPAGYEFVSLVQAVLLAGGRESALSARSRERLAFVDRPVTMQVFTTPT